MFMNDPHVVALYYTVNNPPSVQYDNPPPIDSETNEFKIHLEDAAARVEMKVHCSTEKEARAQVEPYIRAWEISSALDLARSEITFHYTHSEVIDRNPPPGVHIEAQFSLQANGVVGVPIATTQRKNYPSPPTNFASSPDVEIMWRRYEMYLEGRDTLQDVGYFCLTVFEGRETRHAAAQKYNVTVAILNNLGKLVSVKGDELNARKYIASGFTPLSEREAEWIRQVLKTLIRRIGEYEYNGRSAALLPTITLRNFPPI